MLDPPEPGRKSPPKLQIIFDDMNNHNVKNFDFYQVYQKFNLN